MDFRILKGNISKWPLGGPLAFFIRQDNYTWKSIVTDHGRESWLQQCSLLFLAKTTGLAGVALYTVLRARRITFFLVNRVENQNGGGRLGSFWFSTRPTAMGGTDYKAIGKWDKLRGCSSNCPIVQAHYNQCQCLPKAELKTKTNRPFGFVLVFNSIH